MNKECGNEIKENELIDAKKASTKDAAEASAEKNGAVDNVKNSDVKNDKNPKNKGIAIILILLVLVGIGAFVYFNHFSGTDKDSEQTKTNWIKAGIYNVGKEIKAGEYVFVATSEDANYAVSSDNSGDKTAVVANDTVTNQAYLTVSKGQYLTVEGGKICAVADTPVYTAKDGNYKDGEYKVGRDLKAGDYKLHSDVLGYYVILSSSDGSISSIVKNENFNSDKTVTLSDGQYIKITDAYMTASNK